MTGKVPVLAAYNYTQFTRFGYAALVKLANGAPLTKKEAARLFPAWYVKTPELQISAGGWEVISKAESGYYANQEWLAATARGETIRHQRGNGPHCQGLPFCWGGERTWPVCAAALGALVDIQGAGGFKNNPEEVLNLDVGRSPVP